MAGYYDEITGEYIDTGDDSYGYEQLDDTSGTDTMEGWSYGNGKWTDPGGTTYDMAYLTPNEQLDVGGVLRKLGQTAANKLVSTFTNPNGSTDWRAVAAAAGGLYGLYQSQQKPEKTGYQGKIPTYEAVREAVPGTSDQTRRPGSGGQRYFSQVKYAAPGEAATAARTAAQTEAAGLETLNRGNPARQERDPTHQAAARGEESANVREGRPASEVIQDKPVPQYAAGGITGLAQGRYLGGPTDGMADKLKAQIDGKQEARLSHGEFVIPADVVSHIGNGNSEAGAKRLYSMMDRIRTARTGTAKQGKQINPNKFMPA